MDNKAISAGILGTGSYLPDNILTNEDLEKMVDTSDEWIIKRTGISRRHILDKDKPAYLMGIDASKAALADAGVTPEELELIIVSSDTPDYLTPQTSCTIQREIGADNAAAFDVNAACTGFLYAMNIASQFIINGTYKKVLVVACEALSKVTDWQDRNTCILFGDGAGAVVMGPVEEKYGLKESCLGSVGKLGHNLTIPCCFFSEEEKERRINSNEKTLWMDGSGVFKFAVQIMTDATKQVMEKASMNLDDINLIFPHQANIRIIDSAVKRLKAPKEKIFVNLNEIGNISSASIPVGLDQVHRSGTLRKGDNLLFVAFGGGLTWGSSIVTWSKER